MRQVKGPIGQVEEGKDGGEDDSGENVNLLSSRRELIEPGDEKVSPLPWLHVDFALVNVIDVRKVGVRTPHGGGEGPWVTVTPHHWLLENGKY